MGSGGLAQLPKKTALKRRVLTVPSERIRSKDWDIIYRAFNKYVSTKPWLWRTFLLPIGRWEGHSEIEDNRNECAWNRVQPQRMCSAAGPVLPLGSEGGLVQGRHFMGYGLSSVSGDDRQVSRTGKVLNIRKNYEQKCEVKWRWSWWRPVWCSTAWRITSSLCPPPRWLPSS